MHGLGPLALHIPAWKGVDAGFQLGGFPAVPYCGVALPWDHLLILALAQMFRTGQYSGLERHELLWVWDLVYAKPYSFELFSFRVEVIAELMS